MINLCAWGIGCGHRLGLPFSSLHNKVSRHQYSIHKQCLSGAIVMLPEAGKSDVRSRSRVCASLPVTLTQ